jgi:hypothetical protein
MPTATEQAKASQDPELDGHLVEYVNSRGASMAVDEKTGVITGVKILGKVSVNNRRYTDEAIRAGAGLYEGKQVNVDHVEAGKTRSYGQRIGRIQNVSVREDGLYGDLHVNPRHHVAEQLFWDAQNASENVGLSHDVQGTLVRRDGQIVVEAITSVNSVDLVANPATTKGLFESTEPQNKVSEPMKVDLTETTLAQFKAARPELAAEFKKEISESVEAKAKDEKIKALTEELKTIKAETAKTQHAAVVAKELHEAKLDPKDDKQCPGHFLEQLTGQPDAAKRALIVADRKTLIEAAAAADPSAPMSSSPYRDASGGSSKRTVLESVAAWR